MASGGKTVGSKLKLPSRAMLSNATGPPQQDTAADAAAILKALESAPVGAAATLAVVEQPSAREPKIAANKMSQPSPRGAGAGGSLEEEEGSGSEETGSSPPRGGPSPPAETQAKKSSRGRASVNYQAVGGVSPCCLPSRPAGLPPQPSPDQVPLHVAVVWAGAGRRGRRRQR